MKAYPVILSLALLSASASASTPSDTYISQAAFQGWVTDNHLETQVQAFEAHLARNGVADVLPTYQILRTSSTWQACQASAFEIPPQEVWANITTTLRYIKTEVEPRIGKVQAVSGYRNARLNTCSGGAEHSAHRYYFALDLLPETDISRATLIREMCLAHRENGQKSQIGLGFYSGVRFHLDSKKYRKWGADGKSATSPCNKI